MFTSKSKHRITAKRFVEYLVANMLDKGIRLISLKTIANKINSYKNSGPEYRDLYDDIEFHATASGFTSKELETAMQDVKSEKGYLGKTMDRDFLVVNMKPYEKDSILHGMNKEDREYFEGLAESFLRKEETKEDPEETAKE